VFRQHPLSQTKFHHFLRPLSPAVNIPIFYSGVPCLNLCPVIGLPNIFYLVCLFLARNPPSGPGPPHSRGFLDHTK
jgi:hypothetical protein